MESFQEKVMKNYDAQNQFNDVKEKRTESDDSIDMKIIIKGLKQRIKTITERIERTERTESTENTVFEPGIKTNVIIKEIKLSEKLNDVLQVTFTDKNNLSNNFTNIFGPNRTFAATDDAFEKMKLNKTSQVCEILACIYAKPNGSFGEAMEEVVSKYPEQCEDWVDIIEESIKIYEEGMIQHQKLFNSNEVNVCGVWVYNKKDYVVLRSSVFDPNIYPSHLITMDDKTKFFKVNERFDRFTKQTEEQVGDDLSKVDGLLGRKVTVTHEEKAELPF